LLALANSQPTGKAYFVKFMVAYFNGKAIGSNTEYRGIGHPMAGQILEF